LLLSFSPFHVSSPYPPSQCFSLYSQISPQVMKACNSLPVPQPSRTLFPRLHCPSPFPLSGTFQTPEVIVRHFSPTSLTITSYRADPWSFDALFSEFRALCQLHLYPQSRPAFFRARTRTGNTTPSEIPLRISRHFPSLLSSSLPVWTIVSERRQSKPLRSGIVPPPPPSKGPLRNFPLEFASLCASFPPPPQKVSDAGFPSTPGSVSP